MKYLILALCIAAANCAINPLSSEQADLVRGAWDQVHHNEVDILYNVFKAHPDIQARFPQFVGKDLESLKDTGSFATHAGRIVGFFSEVIGLIGNTNNAPALKTLTNQLATNHKNRGIPKAQFDEFRASLTSYVSGHVSWGDNVAAAWNQALDNMYFVLFSALDGHPLH